MHRIIVDFVFSCFLSIIHVGSFPEDSRHPFEGTNFSPTGVALSFYSVLFAYDGWYVAINLAHFLSLLLLHWLKLFAPHGTKS